MSSVQNESYGGSIKPLEGIHMRVSALAQRKLIAYARASEKAGGTEVRGALVMDEKDPLYVRDALLMDAQSASGGHIESEGADEVRLFKELIVSLGPKDAEKVYAFIRGDWHKHPGKSKAHPSGTDTGSVYTRMKLHLNNDYYPFIVTNEDGEISSFVGLKLKTSSQNSIVSMDAAEDIQIFSVDTIIDYEDASADINEILEVVNKNDEEVKKIKIESDAAIAQLQSHIKNIEDKCKERCEVFEKGSDEVKVKLVEAITPDENMLDDALQEIRRRLPEVTFRPQQYPMYGPYVPPGTIHQGAIRDAVAAQESIEIAQREGRCYVCWKSLKACACAIPETDVTKAFDKTKPASHSRSDFEDITDEHLMFLGNGICPETGFQLRGKDCQSCSMFFDNRRGGSCSVGYLLPRKAVEWEMNRRKLNIVGTNPKKERSKQERLDNARELGKSWPTSAGYQYPGF